MASSSLKNILLLRLKQHIKRKRLLTQHSKEEEADSDDDLLEDYPSSKRLPSEGVIRVYRQFPFNSKHCIGCMPCELPDAIKTITHKKYNKLTQSGLPLNYSAVRIRRVLASVVLVQQSADDPSCTNICLVALGAGSKSILPLSLSTQGDTVQDCHAEVLARRGLLRFLYSQLKTLLVDGERHQSIFEKPMSCKKFSLREGLSLHLYISRPPCGDAAVFGLEENHPNRLRRGVARMTPCDGEGSVYIPHESDPTFSELKKGEKRLHKMCCSAKIAKWNVVGVQGALLSRLITPIYLKSITIGSEFNEGHMRRAVYERMRSIRDLPGRYEINCPKLYKVDKSNQECSTKKRKVHKISLNWSLMERDKATPYELIECQNGKTCAGKTSRLAKVSLYKCFMDLQPYTTQRIRKHRQYHDVKLKARSYQRAKNKVFVCFDKRNAYGSRWLQMPQNVDEFSLSDQEKDSDFSESDGNTTDTDSGDSEAESEVVEVESYTSGTDDAWEQLFSTS